MKSHGSCFCNKVKFEIIGEIPPPWNCYCKNCSKLHGSAFATHTIIKTENFNWISGKENVLRFASSPGNFRHFCSCCSSQLVVINNKTPKFIVVVYAALDVKNNLSPAIGHLFTNSKVCWTEIKDNITQYDKFPPGDIWDEYVQRWLT